jgi:vacuolar-type H+-ATPase subunit H
MADAAMADAASATAVGPPAPAPTPPQKLDELMLAMDVVDTLRHQDALVARELDETRRESQLIERLRQLYRGQGIEVPDRVLQEGVRALKESRFVYAPPPPGLSRTLALAWVNRGRVGKALLGLLAAVGIGWGAYEVGVVRPAQQRAEQARTQADREQREIAELLPRALEQGHQEVLSEARVDEARQRADQILADGRSALQRRDAAGARRAIEALEELRSDLRREYVLRIVSRPGEPSGLYRIPARNPQARNYYIVVEPVAPDGRILKLPVTSEEDGRTEVVSKWAVRVNQTVYSQVRRDKDDDGIVQGNRLGEKRRGRLDVEYLMPVLGGAILTW